LTSSTSDCPRARSRRSARWTGTSGPAPTPTHSTWS